MRKVLLRDIVIPAGTVFDDAPTQTVRTPGVYGEAIIGLTNDTCGSITYECGAGDPELAAWFSDEGEVS